MGLDLEPVIVSSQRKIGCRIKGFRVEAEHQGLDPIKLKALVKVGDIVKSINGTQVLSAPFDVILDTLRQLKRTTRSVVFKDISANWSEGVASEPRTPTDSFSPSSVKKRARSQRGFAHNAVSASPPGGDDATIAEQDVVASTLVWRYMQNMVAPFAEKVERAAHTLTATAACIPTVTSHDFAQVMQAKHQLLQELADAYHQLEQVDRTNHQLVQQQAEEGKLQHLVELDRQSLLARCGWLEHQLEEASTHKEFVLKQYKDVQVELQQLHDRAQQSGQAAYELERRLKTANTQLSHKKQECEHYVQKATELQHELDSFTANIHSHPLVVELENQLQRSRRDMEQAQNLLAAEREKQRLDQEQMMLAMRARDEAVVEELAKLQNEHAQLYDQHQTFINERQRETLEWHSQLERKDHEIKQQQETIEDLRREIASLKVHHAEDQKQYELRVTELAAEYSRVTVEKEQDGEAHRKTLTRLQELEEALVEQRRMADEEAQRTQEQKEDAVTQLAAARTQLVEQVAANDAARNELQRTKEELLQTAAKIEEQNATIARLQEQLTTSTRSNKEEAEARQKKHEKELHQLQNQLEESRAAASALETKHYREFELMQHDLDKTSKALQIAEEARDAVGAQLSAAHAAVHTMRAALKSLLQQTAELRRELHADRSFIVSQHKAHDVSLKHLKENIAKRAQALGIQFQDRLVLERQKLAEKIAAVEASKKSELKELEQAHANEMRTAKEEHDEYLQQIGEEMADLQARLKELEDEQQRRIDRVVAKEDARRTRLQAEHEREIQELHAMFDSQFDKLLQTHRQELAAADETMAELRKCAEETRQSETQEHKHKVDKLHTDLNAARDSMAGMMATIQAQELALMQAMEQIAEQQQLLVQLQGCDRDLEVNSNEVGSIEHKSEEALEGDTARCQCEEIERLVEERDRLLASIAELEENHAALRAAFENQRQELEDVRLLVEAITNDGADLTVSEQRSSVAETRDLSPQTQQQLTRFAMKKRRARTSDQHTKEVTMHQAISLLLSKRMHRQILHISFLRWRQAQLRKDHEANGCDPEAVPSEQADTSQSSALADVVEAPTEGESFWTISTTDSEQTDVFSSFV